MSSSRRTYARRAAIKFVWGQVLMLRTLAIRLSMGSKLEVGTAWERGSSCGMQYKNSNHTPRCSQTSSFVPQIEHTHSSFVPHRTQTHSSFCATDRTQTHSSLCHRKNTDSFQCYSCKCMYSNFTKTVYH